MGAQTSAHVQRFRLGERFSTRFSRPVIDADGTLYVGGAYVGDGPLYALDPKVVFSGGQPKWAFYPDGRKPGAWTWATPAIGADGLVYAAEDTTGLHALDPAASDSATRERWSYQTQDIGGSAPIIAADGTVFVGTYYHDPVLPIPDGAILALGPNVDPKNPAPRWSDPKPLPNGLSPAIGLDGSILIGGGDGGLYAFSQDGARLWRYYCGGSIDTSPAVASDGTVYLSLDRKRGADYLGVVVAVNPAAKADSERVLWSVEAGTIPRSFAIAADGTIYLGSDNGELYAIKPVDAAKGGAAKSIFQAGAAINRIAIGADGLTYAGSVDKVYAIRPDGSVQWSYATGGWIVSIVIGGDGTVYAVSDDGYLYAFGP